MPVGRLLVDGITLIVEALKAACSLSTIATLGSVDQHLNAVIRRVCGGVTSLESKDILGLNIAMAPILGK